MALAFSLLWLDRLSRITTSPGRRGGGKLGLDPGLENLAVHRPVDQPRCGQAIASQAGDEGLGCTCGRTERLPSPARRAAPGRAAGSFWSWSRSRQRTPAGAALGPFEAGGQSARSGGPRPRQGDRLRSPAAFFLKL